MYIFPYLTFARDTFGFTELKTIAINSRGRVSVRPERRVIGMVFRARQNALIGRHVTSRTIRIIYIFKYEGGGGGGGRIRTQGTNLTNRRRRRKRTGFSSWLLRRIIIPHGSLFRAISPPPHDVVACRKTEKKR